MGRISRAVIRDSNFSRAKLIGLDMHGLKETGNLWEGSSRALAKGDDPNRQKSEPWFERHRHLSR